MDRKVGGPAAALLFLAGLSALVLWFLVFSLQVALGEEPFPTKAGLEAIGLVHLTNDEWGGRDHAVQDGDGHWVWLPNAVWVGGHLGWADKTLQGGH